MFITVKIYFLNTFGSVYSFNLENMKINWFINLNPSIDLNNSNLFDGSPINKLLKIKLLYHQINLPILLILLLVQ